MASNIREMAEAYLVLRDAVSAEDRELLTNKLMEAFIREAGANGHHAGFHTPVAGQPAPTTDGLTAAGADHPYGESAFRKALADSGYTDIDVAWRKWGLTALDIMPLNDRVLKMENIKAVRPSAEYTEKKIVSVLPDAPHAQPDTTRCPKCGNSGKKFEWGYSCDDKECVLPNGKHTTWDSENWMKRYAWSRGKP